VAIHLPLKFANAVNRLDYEEEGYGKSDLDKLTILLNGKPVDPLSIIVHKDKAASAGRNLCAKLKETIHRQMFEIKVQAQVGNKIIARETYDPRLLKVFDIG